MNISFEAQPLFEKHKTGISYCEAGLVRELIKNHPDDDFSFQYFSLRNHAKKKEALREYIKENTEIDVCKFFPGKLYKMITLFFPLPYKWFFKNEGNISHFFNYIVPPFVRGKTVVTVHDLTYITHSETMDKKARLVLKLTAKRSMKRADKIIAVSEFTKNEIVRYLSISPEKISVVYNAVDTEVYRSDYSASEVEHVKDKYGIVGEYFLYLGTLEPRKNLERLLAAYARLAKQFEKAPLMVIAGKKGWLYERIFESVKQFDIESKVIFTGYVPVEDAPLLMKGAMVFCYPSLYEGYGMPVIEAMACGTAVLTSSGSPMEEISIGCAVTVEPKSVESIASGLEKLYTDYELRERLSGLGIAQARKFSWKNEAEKLFDIYTKMQKESE